MTIPMIEVGGTFAGKYRVEKILGAGGMGIVVAARHLQLGQLVAVKFLLAEAATDPEVLERFRRESRAAVQIQSQHVARVIDVGELENGLPYMVMEYLQGGDLSQILRDQGPFPIQQAVGCIVQACEAIAEAHALGIIHRDLKPANLFLASTPDGISIIKVLDFGISKASSPTGFHQSAALTKPAVVMGSPLYMSPEQFRSARDVDARSDIWSLGVILYELLTGHPPFMGDSLPQLCTQILTDPPRPVASYRKGIPSGLEHVIVRCLQKDPKNRFADVAELARALVGYGPSHAQVSSDRISRVLAAARSSDRPSTVGRVPGPKSGVLAASQTGALSRSFTDGPRPSRAWIGVAVAVALAGGAIGIGWSKRSTHQTDIGRAATLPDGASHLAPPVIPALSDQNPPPNPPASPPSAVEAPSVEHVRPPSWEPKAGQDAGPSIALAPQPTADPVRPEPPAVPLLSIDIPHPQRPSAVHAPPPHLPVGDALHPSQSTPPPVPEGKNPLQVKIK